MPKKLISEKLIVSALGYEDSVYHPLVFHIWCDSSEDFLIYNFTQGFNVSLMLEWNKLNYFYVINSLYAPFLVDIL